MNGLKRKPAYSPKELQVADALPNFFGGPDTLLLNTPVSYRENVNAHYFSKEPWFVAQSFVHSSSPMIPEYNDQLSRPFGCDMVDCFGVPWKWVESAGGSITPGGNPLFEDANEWRDHIKMPDINAWDWEAASKNKLDGRLSGAFTFINGFWFERLVSFMDFENAAMALVDEDQVGAVKDLFRETTQLAIDLVDKIIEYFPGVDGFTVHDDWGAQRAPFFSDEVATEVFLPFMTELVDHVHKKGRYITIHSCGALTERAHIFVEAGLDGWQMMEINDLPWLYENYGDKLVLEAWPDKFDVTDDAAAVEAARNFVDRYCKPGKPSILGYTAGEAMASKVFMEELYTYSRKKYLGL